MRRKVIEEPVNHERWLVSYADFITLLFAFFVVMYSISQVSESKYRVLSNTLSDAFNLPEHQLDPIQIGMLPKSNPISLIELREGAIVRTEQQGSDSASALEPPPNPLDEISSAIDQAFGDLIDQQKVTVRGNEEWLEVELSSSLLFGSGDAVLGNGAIELLGEISAILKNHDSAVRVEGFTDNVPIRSSMFPSNWELSAARAAAVVKLFMEESIAPQRLAAVGYGEFQPVADNSTEEGRAKNRRVVLMISKSGEMRPELPSLEQSPDEVNTPTPAARAPANGLAGEQTTENEQAVTAPVEQAESIVQPDPMQGVRKVELKGGGLLFTSEPASTAEAADNEDGGESE